MEIGKTVRYTGTKEQLSRYGIISKSAQEMLCNSLLEITGNNNDGFVVVKNLNEEDEITLPWCIMPEYLVIA